MTPSVFCGSFYVAGALGDPASRFRALGVRSFGVDDFLSPDGSLGSRFQKQPLSLETSRAPDQG